jgi:hypothetical protein
MWPLIFLLFTDHPSLLKKITYLKSVLEEEEKQFSRIQIMDSEWGLGDSGKLNIYWS